MRKGRVIVVGRRRAEIDTRQLAEAVLAALDAQRSTAPTAKPDTARKESEAAPEVPTTEDQR